MGVQELEASAGFLDFQQIRGLDKSIWLSIKDQYYLDMQNSSFLYGTFLGFLTFSPRLVYQCNTSIKIMKYFGLLALNKAILLSCVRRQILVVGFIMKLLIRYEISRRHYVHCKTKLYELCMCNILALKDASIEISLEELVSIIIRDAAIEINLEKLTGTNCHMYAMVI